MCCRSHRNASAEAETFRAAVRDRFGSEVERTTEILELCSRMTTGQEERLAGVGSIPTINER
jgi:hypothetical protein